MEGKQIENTYVLEAKEDERFYPSKIKKILKGVIDERLKNETFNPEASSALCEELTSLIRARVKTGFNETETKMPRFKLAFQIVIGELKGQGIRVTSKCLWDPSCDNYASHYFHNESLYAVAMVFGCYFE